MLKKYACKDSLSFVFRTDRSCEYGLDECRLNEDCFVEPSSKSKVGVCRCKPGFASDPFGMC